MNDSPDFHRGRTQWVALIGTLGLLIGAQSSATAPGHPSAHSVHLPLAFELNQGQTDARVRFLARGPGFNIFLTSTGAVFTFPHESDTSGHPVVRMQLVGSAAGPQVQGDGKRVGKVNYFRGGGAANWQTRVPTYQRVKYSSVYPGIDLVYYGQDQQLEYDFIVAPGADPDRIELAFAGVGPASVDARGDLVLETSGGAPLRFRKPVIYQLDGNQRRRVEGDYLLRGVHRIGFRLGDYDRTRPLIIDPVLSYSTYLGGSGIDAGTSIAVDATGAMYVSGTTWSVDFPTVTAGQSARNGESDLFVAKLTADGTSLVYATYLGGSGSEDAADIAVDSAGAAYLSALTESADFPTANALHPACSCGPGNADAVVAKLSADGSQLLFSTYLGGSGREEAPAIAVDFAGAAYVAGLTLSTDFPEVNPLQSRPGGDQGDAFVAKLAPDGGALRYSTYLGGGEVEAAHDVAVDSLGAAYVAGVTGSSDFPVVNPLQAGYAGDYDAFVAKLSPDGASLVYATYLGGFQGDQAYGVAVDASGAAYVTGVTESIDFPTMNALQPQHGGPEESLTEDAFVVKIAPEGSPMIYGTFLGGSGMVPGESGNDRGYGIAVDTAGSAHVVGLTTTRDFPTMHAIQPARRGDVDGFVSVFSPDGQALVSSTYLGGNGDDGIRAIALDLTGAAYVTGQTRSRDFPLVNPLQAVFGGSLCGGEDSDAFVAKITSDTLASPAASVRDASPPIGASVTVSGRRAGGGGSMDAIFLWLLAPLACAAALRRRGGR